MIVRPEERDKETSLTLIFHPPALHETDFDPILMVRLKRIILLCPNLYLAASIWDRLNPRQNASPRVPHIFLDDD
jgi:hypothetical protein